jgi:serine protease Do
MKKVLLPVIAGVTMASIAVAQQATPKLDQKPNVRIQKFEMMCGPSSYLGVYPADVTDDKAGEMGMKETYGALLTDVVDSSPARAAGLQKNDIIISWNGARVESAAALRRLVAETPTGRSVRIGYVRGGVPGEIDAKIGNRPAPSFDMHLPEGALKFDMKDMPKDFMKMAPNIGGIFMRGNDPRTGMTLQTVSPQLAKYFGLADGTGALVGSVEPGSTAEKAGLQAGDVVIAIDGEKISSPFDANKIIGPKKEGGSLDVTVIRDKREQTISVALEGKPMEFNMPGLEGLEDMKGPFEIFKSFPNTDGDDQQEDEVAPPDGGSHPELSLRTPDQNHRMQMHVEVIPSREVPQTPPPAGI